MIKMKQLLSVLLVGIAATFLHSCSEPEMLTPEQFKFGKLLKDTINKRDNIILLGENMGIKPKKAKIVIDSTHQVSDTDLVAWTNSKIEFALPGLTGEHYFQVFTETDTSEVIPFFVNEVRHIDFKEIANGEFIMGSNTGNEDEKPSHKVTISGDFYASIYEISQAVFIDVMGENPSTIKDERLPVHNVSWIDAIKFCNKLSEIEGFTPCYKISGETASLNNNGTGYRLPTEAEWEYMCRAGKTGDFNHDGSLNDFVWYNQNSGMMLKESGKLAPNAFGLYDMHGNLWEWCWDNYSADYYKSSPSKDPMGDATFKGEKVARGGSYLSGKIEIRSSHRTQTSKKPELCGIRLVRTKTK